MHQVGNVKWSAKLAKSAEQFAKGCPQEHDEKSSYGENMAWGYSKESMEGVVGIKKLVNMIIKILIITQIQDILRN